MILLGLCLTGQHTTNQDLSHSTPIRLLNGVLLRVRGKEGNIGDHLRLGFVYIVAKQFVVPRNGVRPQADAALRPGQRHADDNGFHGWGRATGLADARAIPPTRQRNRTPPANRRASTQNDLRLILRILKHEFRCKGKPPAIDRWVSGLV